MTTTTAVRKTATRRKPQSAHRNEVRLVGRLGTVAEARSLPSGDEAVGWRLIVDRPEGAVRVGIDVLDCVAYGSRVRRAALRWQPGDTIEVEGALRRRFWRSGAATASRCEVEVTRALRSG